MTGFYYRKLLFTSWHTFSLWREHSMRTKNQVENIQDSANYKDHSKTHFRGSIDEPTEVCTSAIAWKWRLICYSQVMNFFLSVVWWTSLEEFKFWPSAWISPFLFLRHDWWTIYWKNLLPAINLAWHIHQAWMGFEPMTFRSTS